MLLAFIININYGDNLINQIHYKIYLIYLPNKKASNQLVIRTTSLLRVGWTLK